MPIATSHFAAVTFMAAPAVLTNAAAVMAMSTSNRFSRTLDRARFLSQQLEKTDLAPEERALRTQQFERAQVRAMLLLKSLSRFYFSLSCLALATLIVIVGIVSNDIIPVALRGVVPVLAAIAGALGIGALADGCISLVRETRMAVSSIMQEADYIRSRLGSSSGKELEH